jgi:glutamine synthetase
VGTTPPSEIRASGPHTVDGVGQHGFVARHGLYSPEQSAAADEVAARIRELGLRTVRLVVVDQHGQPRSKSLSPEVAIAAMSNGLDFSGAIYSLDTGNQVFVPAFAAGGGFGIDELTGFPDVVLVPDPGTFQVLPWADRTGWMLCDVYFSSGAPMPLDGRGLMRRALSDLGAAGYDFLGGIEVEYYIVKLDTDQITPENSGFTPEPPAVSIFERGYQYLSEVRLDSVAGTLEAIRDGLFDVGLPPRSMEDEWGPGQMEFSFSPIGGLAAADAVVLFRSAVKQICQRRGLLATFMCRPALPNFFSSGWHLHESLISRQDGRNAFASQDETLSVVGRQFVAGLLEHAMPMTVFATPTVNGYKRYRPYSFAPDRVCWAVENRGALVRQPLPLPGRQHRRRARRGPAAAGAAAADRGGPLRGGGADAADVAAGRGGRARRGRLLPEGVRRRRGRLPGPDEARGAGQVRRGRGREPARRRAGRQRLGDARVLRVLLAGRQPLSRGPHDQAPDRRRGRGSR